MITASPKSFMHSNTLQLAVLSMGHLVVDMYAGFLFPLIPALQRHLNVETFALTALGSVCMLLVNGIQPLTGTITSRFRRPVFLIAGPGLAVCMVLIGLTNSYWVFTFLVLVGFIGVGIFHPEGLMAAHVVSGTREHLGVPIFMSSGFLGINIGALLCTGWVYYFDFAYFWLLGIPAVVVLILFSLTNMHSREFKARGENVTRIKFHEINFWWLLFLGVLVAIPPSIFFMFINIDMAERFGRIGERWGGYCIALIGLGSAVGSLVWGYFSKHISPFFLIAIGHVLSIPVYWMLVNSGMTTGKLVAAVLTGLFFGGALFPLIVTIARRARQLTPSMRAALALGGTWGLAGLVMLLCGFFQDPPEWFESTFPSCQLSAHAIMLLAETVLGLAAITAFGIYISSRKQEQARASQLFNALNDHGG